MCHLPNSINIPLENLERDMKRIEELSEGRKPVFCLCRRGIFSVEATRIIKEAIQRGESPNIYSVYNIRGGLESWAGNVDPEFPKY